VCIILIEALQKKQKQKFTYSEESNYYSLEKRLHLHVQRVCTIFHHFIQNAFGLEQEEVRANRHG